MLFLIRLQFIEFLNNVEYEFMPNCLLMPRFLRYRLKSKSLYKKEKLYSAKYPLISITSNRLISLKSYAFT